MNPEGSMESNMLAAQDLEGNILSRPKPVENDGQNGGCLQSNICQSLELDASGDYTSVQQYDQRVAQVGKSQLGKRRRLQFEAAQEKIMENEPGFQSPSNAAAKLDVLDSSSSQKIRSSSLSVSKLSGIGLHLNSIVNAMPMTFSIVGRKSSISISSQMQDNSQCPSMSSHSSSVDNVSARSEDYTHETLYSNANPRMMIEYEDNFNQELLDSKQVGRVDKFERSAPRKKRKKTESTGDGCKRCNCKKTKCLKLYCDCFAAGVYCAGPCSCQGCFNRPEYESTVLETRQQIESRNPLAFTPKVIHRVTQPPRTQTVEDGDQVTPLSGRHKRGCNCKKSMCLKKYCECYQANVGCSDGCRCEGCQNIYGTKAVSGMSREMAMEAINETLNDSFDDKLKVGSIRSRSSLPEFHKPHNLTPQTPSFQHSNHGKDVSKARAFPGRYVPSPESECTFYPSYVTTPTSPKDSSSFDMITETGNKNPEMVTFDQDLYPNIEYTDKFSPGDWSNSSRSQLLPPSSVSLSSLCYHDSSLTPVTLLGGAKSSFDIVDDDTPTVLKDSSSIQPNKVIGTSPNKKRVSPPKLRLHEFGSSYLKSGRKFILKAVPSFPPLTPGNKNL